MNGIKCTVIGCETEATGRPYRISEGVQLNLCQSHAHDVATKTKWRARQIVTDLDSVGGISKHTPGWVYVIRLSDGSVKIGMSASGLGKRLQDLTTKYNGGVPVAVLAVVEGGESREMLYHQRWAHLRIPGTMEAFYQDPSLIEWATSLGVDPNAGLDQYDGYVERRHASGKTGHLATEMFGDTAEQMVNLKKEERQAETESFWN